jgi:hypothetical protein
MSWNTLEIAGELGINRVVVASSVNSIGMSTSFLLPLLSMSSSFFFFFLFFYFVDNPLNQTYLSLSSRLCPRVTPQL